MKRKENKHLEEENIKGKQFRNNKAKKTHAKLAGKPDEIKT